MPDTSGTCKPPSVEENYMPKEGQLRPSFLKPLEAVNVNSSCIPSTAPGKYKTQNEGAVGMLCGPCGE